VTVLYENFVYLQSFLSGAFPLPLSRLSPCPISLSSLSVLSSVLPQRCVPPSSRFVSSVAARPHPHSHIPRLFCSSAPSSFISGGQAS
jgi:hypothetical protein